MNTRTAASFLSLAATFHAKHGKSPRAHSAAAPFQIGGFTGILRFGIMRRFGHELPRCRAFGAEESASLKFLGGNTQPPPRPAPCETKRVRIRVPVSWCRAFGAVSSASLKFAGGNTQSPPAPPHAKRNRFGFGLLRWDNRLYMPNFFSSS